MSMFFLSFAFVFKVLHHSTYNVLSWQEPLKSNLWRQVIPEARLMWYSTFNMTKCTWWCTGQWPHRPRRRRREPGRRERSPGWSIIKDVKDLWDVTWKLCVKQGNTDQPQLVERMISSLTNCTQFRNPMYKFAGWAVSRCLLVWLLSAIGLR